MNQFRLRLWKLFLSASTAMSLILLLAVQMAAGTFFTSPAGKTWLDKNTAAAWLPVARFLGLQGTFDSPLFLILVGLLSTNIFICTLNRQMRGAGGTLGGHGSARLRFWADSFMHFSLLVLLIGGAVKARWGIAGGQYLFVGRPIQTMQDGDSQVDRRLPFEVTLREIVTGYYPLRMRVRVTGGEGGGLFELVEGRESAIAKGVTLRLAGYDPETRLARAEFSGSGRIKSLTFDLSGAESARVDLGNYLIQTLEYRHDIKEVKSLVTVSKDGKAIAEGWLTPRSNLNFRGMSICQTGWGRDDYGFAYITVQMIRDPGAWLFWGGSVIFCLALPLFILAKNSQLRRSSAVSR